MGSNKKRKGTTKSKKKPAKSLQGKVHGGISPKLKSISLITILLITVICFSPSLNNGFVNWDDSENIYANDLITDLNNNNFWQLSLEIFKSDVIGGYNPLSNWTFLLENKIYGLDNPEYWHLTNIILHLVSVSLIFWIGFRLKLGLLGATLFSLLFAIHPMRVESVAWLTERKDVLYGCLYLAALFYYIKAKQRGFRKRDHLIIAVCFILSLFSKIQAVILPVSMILVDYYLSVDAKIRAKDILNKWPYFLCSLAFGLFGISLLSNKGATDLSYTGFSRLFIGSYTLTIYYIKSIVPFRLSPLYPYPAFLDWKFYLSIVSFIGSAYILWLSYFRKWKTVFFGLTFFLANVFFLLQLLGAEQGFLADRFTYIPYTGLFFMYAMVAEKIYKEKAALRKPLIGFFCLILLGYGTITYKQNKIWKESETLWTHVLKYYKNTHTPWANRAAHFRDNDRISALYDYSQYILLKPDDPDPYNSRARLYFKSNEKDSLKKALRDFTKAIELDSEDPEILVNRGSTYARLGDKKSALDDYNQAEKINPEYPNTYLNRSLIYNQEESWEKALNDINKYLELKPFKANIWIEKARLHLIQKDYEKWIAASDKAIGMEPNNGLFFYIRSRGFHYFNKAQDAKESMQKAINLGYNRGNKALIDKILNYD